jgi:FMN reductase
MSDGPIRIVVIKGSVRPGNYTSMAAALVLDELRKNAKISVDVIEPRGMNLPLPGLDGDSPDAARLKEVVAQATGVIFATPEYHGTFSSVTKLVIENLGFPSVLSGKPVALLGVAAGSIGAIKSLEHLRSVVSHIGGLVLPLPVSVANVQRVFDKDGRCLEPEVEKLVRTVPLSLLSYIDRHLCPRLTLERILREGLAKLPEDVVIA